MTPSDLKHYLIEHRRATLQDLAQYFGAEPSAVEGMLDLWQRKGRVTCREAEKCRGCRQCAASATVIYEWRQ
jgi:hypothetical protein